MSFQKTSTATNRLPGCTTRCFNPSRGPATAPYSHLATWTHFVLYTPGKAATLHSGITSERLLSITAAFELTTSCSRRSWGNNWRVARSTKDRERWTVPRTTRPSLRNSAAACKTGFVMRLRGGISRMQDSKHDAVAATIRRINRVWLEGQVEEL